MAATEAARGVAPEWWQEFVYRHPARRWSFVHAIIGGAAPVWNVSRFVDAEGAPRGAILAVVAYAMVWLLATGGILDRYARRRRLGAGPFFAACGVFFWRFLRLAVIAGLVYLILFGAVHAFLFDRLYPWVTRDISVERTSFAWRVVLYGVFLVPLGASMLVFDYARVRMVVEDRRSAIGALVAGARFVRRHAGHAAVVFLANVGLFVIVTAAYVALAPGAGHAGAYGLLLTLGVGQAYVLARLVVKLAFYASATALFQDRLAHAAYAAGPEPVWPDAPVAEAISNAARRTD